MPPGRKSDLPLNEGEARSASHHLTTNPSRSSWSFTLEGLRGLPALVVVPAAARTSAISRRLAWGSPSHRSIPDRRQHLIPAGLQVFAQAPQRFVAGEGLDNVEGQAAAHSILGGGAAEAVQAHSLQAQQRAGLA